ncbi:MAG: SDR family NAD(P)-dependent oxidoreductase [Nitrospirae bacterium]|uniref:SDR family NAD(P)-dependent oxidoreductase n=1 Tax=Candidatus Magnetobacterium casense TaxID=1455061 RepID=UPI00058EC98D|nr:SDR family NAD(P)-dependent oxidoreductase [Candidatus Magnetobacterium casensis]MBF0339076.1 SDR family NAD(P)-dependent oxidoreductase [Nitrospirota bacterium]
MSVALVTGASGGFGREVVRHLLMAGYDVVAHYNSADEDALMSEFTAYSGSVFCLRADLRNKDDITRMVGRIGERYDSLSAVVNAAGITRDSLLLKCSMEDWDDVIGVNLSGTYHVIKATLPLLISSGDAHVINVSSISGVKGGVGQCAYSASKAALLGLTYALARELAEINIRVNALLPGYMETSMGLANPRAIQVAKQQSPLHCLSSVQEAAAFICWMLKSRRITGQVFTLDSRIL